MKSTKNVVKKPYIKPSVTSQELSLRTLLGENGWFNSSNNQIAYGTKIAI